MDIFKVNISDLAVLKNRGLLITVGLGSCVGIALYDQENKVGGLAHILLPNSRQFSGNLGCPLNAAKFADTALPLLIEEMQKIGGKKQHFKAKIAGGGQLFNFQKAGISMGEKNVAAVKSILGTFKIPLQGEDTGGRHGRTMRFFIDSGKVIISAVGRGEKVL